MPIVKTREKNGFVSKIINYAFAFLFFIWLIAGSIILYDTYQDRKLSLTIKVPTELYQTSELKSSSKLGTINPGDNLKVLRVLFEKDRYVVHVQTSNRQRGWILKTEENNLK